MPAPNFTAVQEKQLATLNPRLRALASRGVMRNYRKNTIIIAEIRQKWMAVNSLTAPSTQETTSVKCHWMAARGLPRSSHWSPVFAR